MTEPKLVGDVTLRDLFAVAVANYYLENNIDTDTAIEQMWDFADRALAIGPTICAMGKPS